MNYLRAYCRQEGEPGDAGSPIEFIASTEGIKRDGKSLKAENWMLDNYRNNPVVLWVHDYAGRNLPIGRADVEVTDGQLRANVTFDQEDEFARSVESKYRRGYLNAVSVGWSDVQRGRELFYDLMDVSAVPVPADPDALKAGEGRALDELRQEYEEIFGERSITDSDKSAITADLKKMNMTDVVATHRRLHQMAAQGHILTNFSKADMNWLHAAVEAELRRRAKEDGRDPPEPTPLEWGSNSSEDDGSDREEDYRHFPGSVLKILKRSEPVEDIAQAIIAALETRLSTPAFELPADADVWCGVATAMVGLYRADAAIEDEQRQSLYIALERVYRRLGRTAPEFRTNEELAGLSVDEIAGLFLEGEAQYARAGAMLSSRNRGDLEKAVTLINGVLERATKTDDSERGAADTRTVEMLQTIRTHLIGESDNG